MIFLYSFLFPMRWMWTCCKLLYGNLCWLVLFEIPLNIKRSLDDTIDDDFTIIRYRLNLDHQPEDRPSIILTQICHLIEYVLNLDTLILKVELWALLYHPLLPNVMEGFERTTISVVRLCPKLWKRYVHLNKIFVIWSNGCISLQKFSTFKF